MGELFSTTKAKSLSLFLSSTKHPTARMREELLYSATRMKTSLFSLLLRKSAFERAQVLLLLSFVRIRCFSLFLFAWKNEAFCPCFFVLFFHSFFFVESSRFGSSFSPPALLNECFFQNERTKKSNRHPTPSSLFDCFCGKTLFFRFVLLNHTNNFSLLSILLSLKTHLRNSKRVFKGGLKRTEFTKGLVLSFVLSLGTLYIVKKKEEDL